MLGFVLFILYWLAYYKKRYKENLFILFLLATSCFQLIPSSIIALKPVIGKPYDWVSLILICHLVFRYSELEIKKYLTIPVKLYLLFLAILALNSYFILHIEPKIIVSVFRLHLFLISPLLFTFYDYPTIQKVVKWMCFFTLIASFLFLIQAVFAKPILSSLTSDDAVKGDGSYGLARFYNLPVFAVFALAYYAKQLFSDFNIRSFVYTLIVLLAIIVSFNRNTLLVSIVLLIAVYYHNRSFNLLNFSMVALCLWAITLPFGHTNNKRYDAKLSDITDFTKAFRAHAVYDIDLDELSTSQYRAFHFYERYNYITHRGMMTTLGGIGLANDQSYLKDKLDFVTGVVREDTGEIEQIDTGDIVWSLLILQVGILGIVLFIAVQLNYIRYFYLYREYTYPYLAGIYVLALLITSFFGIDIILPPVLAFVGLLYVLAYKGINESVAGSVAS